MNYKLTLSYDGTRYYGWEHQPDRDTVQGRLEAVLEKMCGSAVSVIGAGRTDAGVHAKAMVANVHLQTDAAPDKLRDYMNRYLPDDICVQEVRIASDRFHARYKAVGKHYCYTCYTGTAKPLFRRTYVTVLDGQPDVEAMRQAASFLIGTHDFCSFCSNPQMKKSTVRTITELKLVQSRDYLYFHVRGDGFLQNMVRILVGTLLEVGFHRMEASTVRQILHAKDRKLAGPTAAAQGLCLEAVFY